MSTTFDPSKEASLHLLGQSTSSNGKAELSLSQAALRPDFWGKGAPKPLRKQELPAEDATAVYWSKRKGPKPIAKLCGAKAPLRWAMLPGAVSALSTKLLDLAEKFSTGNGRTAVKRKEKQELQTSLTQWLDAAAKAPPSYDLAVSSLAAAHLLDGAGCLIAPTLAWRVLDHLGDTARHAPGWTLGANAAPDEVIAAQMLGGELPLTLGYLFSEMTSLGKGARGASEYLSDSILELLNGQGLPRAAHLSALRPLLACWTRCRAIAEHIKRGGLAKKAEWQYEWLVEQSLRWTAPDGTMLMAGESGEEWSADLLRAALKFGGSKKDAAAARKLLGKSVVKGAGKSDKTPAAAYNCEWSGLAVMRREWSPDDAVLAIDYSTPHMRLELWAGRRRLFGGVASAESHIDGQLLRPTGAWEELCWFKDNDVNYLELSLPVQEGTRLERQILLALRDGFLLIADHLVHDEPATLEHVLQAPLGAGLLFCGEGETRDALLVDGEPLARLMPLALPEWRIDPRVGELSLAGGAMRLSEKADGRALACPLFIDLRADRAGKQSTWRQLTVAELLQIQSADAAVSYRIQSGDDQWVYYRSQGPRGNRTFIGQNTSSECLIARFKAPSGKIWTLLEIEG